MGGYRGCWPHFRWPAESEGTDGGLAWWWNPGGIREDRQDGEAEERKKEKLMHGRERATLELK